MRFDDIFKGVKGAIFDMDGTLVDSLGIWRDIDKRFFKEHNRELPLDYQKKILHMNFMEMAHFTKKEYGFAESAQEIADTWMRWSKEGYANDIKAKPGACQFIKRAKEKGITTSLATANKRELFESCLINNDMEDLFDYTLDVNSINSSKSSPLIYQKLAKMMDVDIGECIVFEDILTAIKVAKSAGFKVCAVYDKLNEEHLEEIKETADMIIYDYRDII